MLLAAFVAVSPAIHHADIPNLLHLLVETPLLLPQIPRLLVNPQGQPHPLTANGTLVLAAWKLSAAASSVVAFRQTLSNCYSHNMPRVLKSSTIRAIENGVAGVSSGELILLAAL